MNKIRKNEEKEKVILGVKFEVPFLDIVLFLISILLLMWGVYFSLKFKIKIFTLENTGIFLIFIICIEIILPLFIYFIIRVIIDVRSVKKNRCEITNKRITGVSAGLFSITQYSYRLDEIDNVDIRSVLGMHTLLMQFLEGHGPKIAVGFKTGVDGQPGYMNGFKIKRIKNYQEVYEKLSELICSIKNDKDLQVDIEMAKVDVENRKASAFENMAKSVTRKKTNKNVNIEYIEQIKQLKKLLEEDIITEEEFEKKKKQLLS